MGKTTNNLLAAGEAAMEAAGSTPIGLDGDGPYASVRKLHIDTMDTLQTDEETRAEVMTLLDQLHQLLGAIGIMQVCVSGVVQSPDSSDFAASNDPARDQGVINT
jgi:hypothetical protein